MSSLHDRTCLKEEALKLFWYGLLGVQARLLVLPSKSPSGIVGTRLQTVRFNDTWPMILLTEFDSLQLDRLYYAARPFMSAL